MTNGIFGSGPSMMYLALGLILCAAAGYFIGSVNTAIILSRVRYNQDIRDFGSKNAGMTNVLRTYGKGAAAATLIGDIGKAVIACLIGIFLLGESGGYVAGFFCVIGHIFPLYYNFKGGKGVLALAAVVLVLNWQAFIVLFTLFVIIVSFSKYISLGSVICALLYPIILSKFAEPNIFGTVTSIVLAIIVAVKHSSNIQRLWAGEENKLKLGKKPLKPWKLVIINVLLVCVTLFAIVANTVFASGMLQRKNDAVRFENYYISELQLRYIYIKTANDYLNSEENAQTDIVKNYNPQLSLNEQTVNGKTYAEYFMQMAIDKCKELLVIYAAADFEGKVVSPKDDRCLAEYEKMRESFIFGDSYGRYINRVYGRGVGESDIRNIIQAQITVGEYLSALEEGASDHLIQSKEKYLTVDEETVEKIINGEYI